MKKTAPPPTALPPTRKTPTPDHHTTHQKYFYCLRILRLNLHNINYPPPHKRNGAGGRSLGDANLKGFYRRSTLSIDRLDEPNQHHMLIQQLPQSHQGKLLPAPETQQIHHIVQPLHQLPGNLDDQPLVQAGRPRNPPAARTFMIHVSTIINRY